jgi:hypothetical protein
MKPRHSPLSFAQVFEFGHPRGVSGHSESDLSFRYDE